MFRKILTAVMVLLFSAGLLTAKEKAVPLKKFKQTDIGNPSIAGSSVVQDKGIQIIAGDMKAIYPAKSTGTPEFTVNYPNTWIRLKRSGNKFIGYHSVDGKNWKIYATYTLDLNQKIYLGLAVTSHNVKESAIAVYKDIMLIK